MKYKLIKPINQNYSPVEQILTNRGIPFNEISHYINTTDNDINPPEALGEDKLKAATALLIKTIQSDNQALVIVDADADGFTSSAILINYLHDLFPSWVENKLTYRVHDGKQHGLNDHIEWILKVTSDPLDNRNYSLVILPDAGSNDTEECKKLSDKNIKTIVLDHHLCDQFNPYALVINNQLYDYPNKDFSGAGIVYQFCRYIDKLLQINNADNYLDLTALGLCADMMSMKSIETKHIENKGFQNLKNPFFVHLAEKNAYSMKNKINHMSVAFYIAPYINAICRSGSIEQKQLVFESMLKYKAFNILPSTKRGHSLGETEQLVEQAMRVVANVKARQTKAQDAGLDLLEQMIQSQNLLNHKVLLFLLEPGQIDRNIAGLSANKLMAKYQRPVCVLTKVTEYQDAGLPWEEPSSQAIVTYQGSARGCDKVGINDFKSICAETGVCEYCTGHPGAFGVGIKEENIQVFIEKTDTALIDMPNEAIYYVDYIYQENNINPDDILSIADMEDLWGKDMDQSLICIEHIKVSSDMVTVYQKRDNTLKITLPNGISLMKFKATDEECYKLQNQGFGYMQLNIIGKANKNEWMGNISPQIFIEQYEIIDSNKYIF